MDTSRLPAPDSRASEPVTNSTADSKRSPVPGPKAFSVPGLYSQPLTAASQSSQKSENNNANNVLPNSDSKLNKAVFNAIEAALVAITVDALLTCEVQPSQIGVISPYRA